MKICSHSTHLKQQWSKSISVADSVRLALANPDSPLKKSYDNTYHCASVKHYLGDKMKTTYCKNRWCRVCNRIRTAVNIQNYGPAIAGLVDAYFVTLTRRTVWEDSLESQIEEMENIWRIIYKITKDKRKKPFKDGIYLKGIRSMECTVSKDGRYHYHFHLIVEGKENAEWLKSEWLKRNNNSVEAAQDIRPADKGAIIEVLKYSVKMSVGLDKTGNYQKYDKIFQALRGKRTTVAFGGLKAAKIDDEDFQTEAQSVSAELKMKLGDEPSLWVWNQEVYDWVNPNSGELLIDEPLPDRIMNYVKPSKENKPPKIPKISSHNCDEFTI